MITVAMGRRAAAAGRGGVGPAQHDPPDRRRARRRDRRRVLQNRLAASLARRGGHAGRELPAPGAPGLRGTGSTTPAARARGGRRADGRLGKPPAGTAGRGRPSDRRGRATTCSTTRSSRRCAGRSSCRRSICSRRRADVRGDSPAAAPQVETGRAGGRGGGFPRWRRARSARAGRRCRSSAWARWQTLDVRGAAAEANAHEVVQAALAAPARAFLDSSPMYGEAERVLGEGLGAPARPRRSWPTRSGRPRRRGRAPGASARLRWYGGRVDLYQVHNLVNTRSAPGPARAPARRGPWSATSAPRTTARARSASSRA